MLRRVACVAAAVLAVAGCGEGLVTVYNGQDYYDAGYGHGMELALWGGVSVGGADPTELCRLVAREAGVPPGGPTGSFVDGCVDGVRG